MSASTTPSAPDYATELAAATLAALRSLLETLNTTDDPVEKRRIATAILRIPDPDAPARRTRALRTPAAPEQSADLPPQPQTPINRLAHAAHVVAQTDDETIRTFVLNNIGGLPDLSYTRFKRIMAGGRADRSGPAPARSPQTCAAGL